MIIQELDLNCSQNNVMEGFSPPFLLCHYRMFRAGIPYGRDPINAVSTSYSYVKLTLTNSTRTNLS